MKKQKQKEQLPVFMMLNKEDPRRTNIIKLEIKEHIKKGNWKKLKYFGIDNSR